MEKEAIDEKLKADESKVITLKERFLELMIHEELDEVEVRPVICDEDNGCFVRRCLVASHNNEKKAYKLGVEGIRWRSKIKPSKITLDDFPTAVSQNTHALGCHAKDGNPVVYVKLVNWDPWKYSTEEHEKLIAFILETCQKAQDPGKDEGSSRIYLIHDMRNMSKFNSDLGKCANLAKLVSVYYPECVVGVAINSDFLTQTLWKFVSPIIDKRTRDRVSIFRDNFEEFLESHIGLENVGQDLGGTCTDEWPPISADTLQDYVAKYHHR